MKERVLSSSNQAAPGLFQRDGGWGGDKISLLMEEKFLQIEPVKYLQVPLLLNRGRLGQEEEARGCE